MVLAAYTMSAAAAIACIIVAVGCGGFAWSGFSVNHLDIAPQVIYSFKDVDFKGRAKSSFSLSSENLKRHLLGCI